MTQASNPIYPGTFPYGIDPKNRITIPAGWRTEEGATFYVRVDSTGSFIQVMPPDEFRKNKEAFANLAGATPAVQREAVRQFSARTQECKADKQGRMVLPAELCQRVGLTPDNESFLVGATDWFEIWEAERWKAHEAEVLENYLSNASRLGL